VAKLWNGFDVIKGGGHTGAIVALMLPANVAQRLIRAVDSAIDSDPEPAKDLHITLAYLGDTSDPDVAGNYFHCKQALNEVSRRMPPISGVLNGIGRFHQDEGSGTQALWAAFDSPDLPAWRQELVEALGALSVPVGDNHGFTPHITLAYLPSDAPTPRVELPAGELTFDRLTLCWGDNRQAWPLLGKVIEKAETVTTETGLVADDRAPRRKRKRGKRRPIDVGALIDSEAAGALDWAKKAAGGDDTPAVAKVDTVLSAAPIIIPVTMPAGDNQAVERALETCVPCLRRWLNPRRRA
jgi:2'-5' RNA ligase